MNTNEAKSKLYNFHRFGQYISPGDYDKAIEVLGRHEAEKVERSALHERNVAKWKREGIDVK